LPHEFQADIDAIADIPAVSSIFDVIRQTTGMGFAAVARVTEGRWIACEVLDNIDFGLKPGGELQVETTICHEIRQNQEAVAIDHVDKSDIWIGHHTPLQYGFQSYISVPITLSDGTFFGTLCAIDPRPAQVNNSKILTMFKLFAELIANHLDARNRLVASEERLQEEIEVAEIREQFIAVLGHDLRNPLASIGAGARLLTKSTLDDRARTVVAMMLKSVDRMGNLVDNVMDFARGRLGGGISLQLSNEPLQPALDQVVGELRSVWTEREIVTHFALERQVSVDHKRIAQLFSNLLGNALTHGAADLPVLVMAATSDTGLELSVSNGGKPIPDSALEKLFQPFSRHHGQERTEGLGLGLYIASRIAEAHGGRIDIVSTSHETRFTLRIPMALLPE